MFDQVQKVADREFAKRAERLGDHRERGIQVLG
jgi:hypothetical protein